MTDFKFGTKRKLKSGPFPIDNKVCAIAQKNRCSESCKTIRRSPLGMHFHEFLGLCPEGVQALNRAVCNRKFYDEKIFMHSFFWKL